MKPREELPVSGYMQLSYAGEDNGYLELTLRDDDSGVEFFAGRITVSDFVKLLGRTDVRYTGVVRSKSLLGLKWERKTVQVPMGRYATHGKDEVFLANLRAAVAPFEVDGWTASEYDLSHHNWHRWTKDNKHYVVNLSRYVPREAVVQSD